MAGKSEVGPFVPRFREEGLSVSPVLDVFVTASMVVMLMGESEHMGGRLRQVGNFLI
jgi:hypothetical protein